MKIFTSLYDKCLEWSRHKYAVSILCFISLIESIFFPIPTAIMFAPMTLAQPKKAFHLAFLTTVFSVLGGVIAYFIGLYAFDSWVMPLVEDFGYAEKIIKAKGWFVDYGIWIVLIAGFSPIPYKVLTLTAGAMAMSFIPFLLASIVGRAAQFYLIAGLVYWKGEEVEDKLKPYMERIGWGVIILAVAAYAVYQLLKS